MQAPLSWLKDYVDINITPQQLAEKLISSGYEVEELKYLANGIKNIVVGQITEITKHENSDHLLICQVNVGNKTHQIVTGADNVFVGAKVPVCLPGAVLPSGKTISSGELRGVKSEGMLTGGQELGIDDDWYQGASVDGILILQDDVELGQDIAKVVGLDDYIFDISITANRPDCQSIYGMAREIAAILGKELKQPKLSYKESSVSGNDLKVKVQDFDLCPRYIAHYVSDIKIEKSPQWLRKRLALVGVSSVNNIVDITNFVLYELGQPMHAFDMNALHNHDIVVRRAKDKEMITTLDDKEFTLNTSNLVIADDAKPVALAGIMGGLNSEIKDTTFQAVFESAKFIRESVRKTSRALGQSSDSSRRFEKGVDEYTVEMAINRALSLVEDLKCGTVSNVRFDQRSVKEHTPQVIKASINKINEVLGIAVSAKTMVEILKKLYFKVTQDHDTLTVVVPPFREDLESYADIAEEIIRMYGYDNIVSGNLENASITVGGRTQQQKDILKLKKSLAHIGYYETNSYSFYSQKDLDMLRLPKNDKARQAIKILNPISEDLNILRTTLAPSMINLIVRNMKKGNDEGRFFEFANRFIPKSLPLSERPIENKMLCVASYGDQESFYTLKGMLETLEEVFGVKFGYDRHKTSFLHPGRSAVISIGQDKIGYIGQVAYDIIDDISATKDIYIAEINFDALYSHIDHKLKYNPISRYNDIKRDIAVLVDKEVANDDIVSAIQQTSAYIKDIKLFDVYEGKQIEQGKKSMAYNLTISAVDKELSLDDVDSIIKDVLQTLEKQLNAVLR